MNNETVACITVGPPPAGASFRLAYERRLAEIQVVPVGDQPRLAIDVHQAVATVLGALPAIRSFREAMTGLAGLNVSLVDGLEDYAWATSEANGRYEHATSPAEDLGPLLEEAMKARETFRLDAVSLAHRGYIERDRLAAFKGHTGFKNVAFDLLDWAIVLRECWPKIEGKSGLSAEEVDAAARLGEHLLTQASLREQQPERIAEAFRIRLQAMTLLVQAYDEVRRALKYLRWKEDDVDLIAPSLFQKSKRRKSKGDSEPPDGESNSPASEPPAPAAPAPPLFAGADDEPVEEGFPGGSPLRRRS